MSGPDIIGGEDELDPFLVIRDLIPEPVIKPFEEFSPCPYLFPGL